MEIYERTRLEKLLEMLGSSFDGERANAARMITHMAEAKKITINDLIATAHQTASGSRQQQAKYRHRNQTATSAMSTRSTISCAY